MTVDASILEGVMHIFRKELGVSPGLLNPKARLVEDVGLDSVDFVQLASAVEKAFRVRIPDERLEQLIVLADVVDAIESLRALDSPSGDRQP